jgi:hypothetical protein
MGGSMSGGGEGDDGHGSPVRMNKDSAISASAT